MFLLLRWVGHIMRVEGPHLPKAVFYTGLVR